MTSQTSERTIYHQKFENIIDYLYDFSVKNVYSTDHINPLEPSDPCMGRTAPLTSRRCILNTYSTITRTEYFKRAA
jgi:hypothetical protein